MDRVHLFKEYSLDLARGCLLQDGKPIHLRPQSFLVLKYLVENKAHLISKDKLIEEVWQGRSVTDGSLGKCIEELREALGPDGRKYVRNVRGRGYILDPELAENGQALTWRPEQIEVDSGPLEEQLGSYEIQQDRDRQHVSIKRRQLPPRALRLPSQRAAAICALILCFLFIVIGYIARNRGWTTRSTGTEKMTLMVLPFENPGNDPEQEFFSDGMTEEMITELANLQPERLAVIARASSMRYKHSDKGIDQIARELGVDYVLECSALRSNGRVRITARLIKARDQTLLWAQSYERELRDVLTLQSEVASSIAREIALQLSSSQQVQLASSRQINPEAHEAYLKGLFYFDKFSESGMKKSIDYFQQAIEKDPAYAQPYARMARAYGLLGNFNVLRPEEAYPKQKEAALKALELNHSLAEAYTALGWSKLFYDRDWSGAREDFQRAVEISPNYATAHQGYAMYFVAMGKFDESHAEILRALELDPVSLSIRADAGWFLFFARRTDESIAQLKEVVEMEPNFSIGHSFLANAYDQKGMFEQAVVEAEKAVQLFEGSENRIAALGQAYALAGKKREANEVLARLKAVSREHYISPYNTALIYASLGQNDEALNLLEQAYRERFWMMAFLNVDPRWDTLRSQPRFIALLRQTGFAAQQ